MAQKDIGNKVPIHSLNNTEQVRDFYNDWLGLYRVIKKI